MPARPVTINPHELSLVGRFVLLFLLDATKKADYIYLKHFSDTNQTGGRFSILFEKEGLCSEYLINGDRPDDIFRNLSMPPAETWQKILRRLKVLSETVDCGPNKSRDGHIEFRMNKDRVAVFYMTTNPNPYSDNEVTLINKGIQERGMTSEEQAEWEREVLKHFDNLPANTKTVDAKFLIAISPGNPTSPNNKDVDAIRENLE